MTTPIESAPAASPLAALYDGLTLRVLGYASAVPLTAAGTGMAFKVPLNLTAFLAICIVDGFSAAAVSSGVTIGYGTVSPNYGELYSATLGDTVGNGVGSVLVTVAGTDYVAIPTVEFSSVDNGQGAAAVASIGGGAVTGITVTNPGSGYVVAPTIDIQGAHTILAEAQAVLGTATVRPNTPVIIAQPPGLARLSGGTEVHWSVLNPVASAGTCNITWLGDLR